ncbi:MAG TPA: hypothetical protein DEA05_07180 [Rhodobacteraceae bacterium]|jgi:membrane protein|nr:hypothetical protein [Paracoccaceae bacterium]
MLWRWKEALFEALGRFITGKGGSILAPNIAFSLMLALFPFLLFILSLAVTFSTEVDVEELIDLILSAWPEEVARPIERELRAVAGGADGGLTLGALLTLFFASNGVESIRQAMTLAYHDVDRRPVWKTRLIGLGLVILGSGFVLAFTGVAVAFPLYMHFVGDALPAPLSWLFTDRIINLILTLGLVVPGVFVCHLVLPGGRHGLRNIWPGVILTVALWALAARGFAFYISHYAAYSVIYAGLAGVISALIFLYLLAAILIFGAEFNGALIRQAKARDRHDPDAAEEGTPKT